MAEIESAESFAERHHIVPGCVEPLREWGEAHHEAGRQEARLPLATDTIAPAPEPGVEHACRGRFCPHESHYTEYTDGTQPGSLVEQVTPMLGITATDPSVDGYETAVLTLAERIDELTARFETKNADVEWLLRNKRRTVD